MKYKIYTDVSTDIDMSTLPKDSLFFIPMEYSLGSSMRTCYGPESAETLHTFYDGQRGGDLTKTSQISPYNYCNYLEEDFKAGYSVLYLSLSSGLSSTFQSAKMAQEDLKEQYPDQDFYPVDTLSATGGMGVLAERAVRNQQNGMSLEENYQDILAASKRVKAWFLVPDLMYLKRGGRVSSATAVIGTALNITPILRITKEGTLDTIQKARGSKAAMNALIKYFDESFDGNYDDVVYVVNADTPETEAYLVKALSDKYSELTIKTSGLSPIIGAHTGPNMAAICHMGKEDY